MTRNPPRDLAASVRQRLLNRARQQGRPYGELSRHFAMERFLYRLSQSPCRRRFFLKGALMFVVWRAPRSRPTMDIDLASLGACSGEEIRGLIRTCCLQSVEPDGLMFDPASLRSAAILEQARYVGLRCRVTGALGVERVTVQVDVAVASSHEKSALVAYPTLLDQPAPWLLGCSREFAVAEKLHAIVSRGEINTRLKDFYDLWLLSRHFQFDGEVLSRAVRSVFRDRDTAISAAPIGLTGRFASDPVRQAQWAAFVRKRLLEGAPQKFVEVVECVAGFLGPLAEALAEEGLPGGVWLPGGPWRKARPPAIREPRASWIVPRASRDAGTPLPADGRFCLDVSAERRIYLPASHESPALAARPPAKVSPRTA